MVRSTLSARARFAAARVWHRRARHRRPRCGGCDRAPAPPRARGRVVVLREGFGGLVRAVCAVVHRARRDGPRAARAERLSDGRHADAADSAPGPGRRRARERLEDRRALRRQHRGRGDRGVPHGFRTGTVVRSHEHATHRGPPERDRRCGRARSGEGVDTSAEDGQGGRQTSRSVRFPSGPLPARLDEPCARAVRLRRDGPGDRLAPPLHAAAWRFPRRVFARPHDRARGHRRRIAARRLRSIDGRPGPLRP